MEHHVWQTEPNNVLSSAAGEFRLIVRRMDGCARFLVLRCPREATDDPHTLAGSGTEDDVRAAMTGAEEMAARLTDLASRAPDLRGSTMLSCLW